ncbi:MAG: hypothetical protein U0903_01040 [Planctomycetales bacterium]
MSSQGPNNPGSSVSSPAAGTSFWINPGNVFTSDSNYTGFDAESSGDSEYLDITGFGFSIPAGSTINGILFEVRKREAAAADNIYDKLVKALKAGTAVGSDLKSASEWGTTFAYASYGGAANLLGTTWTANDINHSGFGIRIQAAESVGQNTNAEGRIDHIRCTVTYTPPAGGVFAVSCLNGLTRNGKEFNRLD